MRLFLRSLALLRAIARLGIGPLLLRLLAAMLAPFRQERVPVAALWLRWAGNDHAPGTTVAAG